MAEQIIGVIGGSGLYELEGLTELRSVALETPFGSPSDEFITGVLDGKLKQIHVLRIDLGDKP